MAGRTRTGGPAPTHVTLSCITQLGVYGFDEETKRLTLLALHPNVTLDVMRANSACKILIPSEVGTTEPPTEHERRLLREIDLAGLMCL